jgi:hypothetical protein
MWSCAIESLPSSSAIRYTPQRDGKALPYREVLRLWQGDEPFRTFFISLLADAPLAGFRWETPPITAATADRPFEFVLLDAPRIDRRPDTRAFTEQFRSARGGERVIAFPNLGNDAVLVVPLPTDQRTAADYVHLAAFVRRAPAAQVHELWQVVARAMEERLSDRPVWLSTAGMGVAWLHVRLDSRPKYYGFDEYRKNA